jgi:hypothetical protein
MSSHLIQGTPMAAANMVVRVRHIRKWRTAIFGDVHSVSATDQQIVVDRDFIDGAETGAEKDRRSLVVFIDDRVVLDRNIVEPTDGLDAIKLRRRRPTHIVDIIVLDDRVVAANIDAVGAVVDVVGDKRTLTRDALAASTQIADIAVLYNGPCYAGLDENNVKSTVRNLAVF